MRGNAEREVMSTDNYDTENMKLKREIIFERLENAKARDKTKKLEDEIDEWKLSSGMVLPPF